MQHDKHHPCFLTSGQSNPNSPLFVYLPGMDGTGELLKLQTNDLEKAFDVRCLAIPTNDSSNWDDLASIVINLVKSELEQRPSRSVYLCGESFGGCLAIKVALNATNLFERIILSNPATSFNQRPWLRWGAQLNQWIPDTIYGASALAFLPFLCALGRLAPRESRALLNAMRSIPAQTASWRITLLAEFEVDQVQLQRLTQPVLILAGGADRLLPSVKEAERLVNCLPHAQMVVLPQSGHACLLESDVNLFEIMKEEGFIDPSLVKHNRKLFSEDDERVVISS